MSDVFKKVIVALDYEDPEKAYRLVDELGDLIDWFKVGPILFTRSGEEIISYLHNKRKKIFLDLKLHDTPNVVQAVVKQIADMGVSFATIHCLGGRQMLQAAGAGCRNTALRLLGVTLLTSQRSQDTQAFGLNTGEEETVRNLMELALESRLAGVLLSPHEIEAVRPKILPGFLLVTPGIRIPGQEVYQDDQQRIASPKEALALGADYLIIGRPLTMAVSPRDVLNKLV